MKASWYPPTRSFGCARGLAALRMTDEEKARQSDTGSTPRNGIILFLQLKRNDLAFVRLVHADFVYTQITHEGIESHVIFCLLHV